MIVVVTKEAWQVGAAGASGAAAGASGAAGACGALLGPPAAGIVAAKNVSVSVFVAEVPRAAIQRHSRVESSMCEHSKAFLVVLTIINNQLCYGISNLLGGGTSNHDRPQLFMRIPRQHLHDAL